MPDTFSLPALTVHTVEDDHVAVTATGLTMLGGPQSCRSQEP